MIEQIMPVVFFTSTVYCCSSSRPLIFSCNTGLTSMSKMQCSSPPYTLQLTSATSRSVFASYRKCVGCACKLNHDIFILYLRHRCASCWWSLVLMWMPVERWGTGRFIWLLLKAFWESWNCWWMKAAKRMVGACLLSSTIYGVFHNIKFILIE